MKKWSLILMAFVFIASCKKKEDNNSTEPQLIFQFRFDPTQQRLNNFGLPAAMPAGHAGQNPSMNRMSAHYIELAPSALTALGSGTVLYHAPETTAGGATAIDFSKSVKAADGEVFYSIPLSSVASGEYEYLRVSLAYQNFDVQMHLDTVIPTPFGTVNISQDFPCTIASFVGYNTYISNFSIKNQSVAVNANKLQGFWGFESSGSYMSYPYNFYQTGQAPAGATTVVNPISSTSPIPAGSCVVTGPFRDGKLKITGSETSDIVIVVSLSTNKSFEWVDANSNGKWEPMLGENIVDMGLRGMVPYKQ